MKTKWKNDTLLIRRLDYIHNSKYGKTFKYTIEGHQRTINEQVLRMILKYEQTGVIE